MYRWANEEKKLIIRERDGACIPVDPLNGDYLDAMAWEKLGNEIPIEVPTQSIPAVVTPRQAKLALYGAGLLETVEAAIAAADKATQITWNEAIEFRRDDPLINGLGKQLGLTDAQIDQLFVTASKL